MSETIAAAIAATVAGGTVNVSAGIYNENNININKALTLNGANMDVPSGSRGPALSVGIRISIGTPQENERCLNVLKGVI